MAVIYNRTSAYADTGINNFYLDIMIDRPIPAMKDDVLYKITQTFHLKPYLLAHDLYDDDALWWVFAQRNPDVLKNPLLDFVVGTEIYIPKQETLRNYLGF